MTGALLGRLRFHEGMIRAFNRDGRRLDGFPNPHCRFAILSGRGVARGKGDRGASDVVRGALSRMRDRQYWLKIVHSGEQAIGDSCESG